MDSKLPDQKDIQTTMPEVDVQATWRKHGWIPPSERIKTIPEKKESIPSILLRRTK